jgi:hypothetical protein
LRPTYLFVLQTHEDNLLHESQLRLFTPFRALADIPWVECDLVPILGALVRCFWCAIVGALRCWRADPAAFILARPAACSTSSSRQTGARGHCVLVERAGWCFVGIIGHAPQSAQGCRRLDCAYADLVVQRTPNNKDSYSVYCRWQTMNKGVITTCMYDCRCEMCPGLTATRERSARVCQDICSGRRHRKWVQL